MDGTKLPFVRLMESVIDIRKPGLFYRFQKWAKNGGTTVAVVMLPGRRGVSFVPLRFLKLASVAKRQATIARKPIVEKPKRIDFRRLKKPEKEEIRRQANRFGLSVTDYLDAVS